MLLRVVRVYLEYAPLRFLPFAVSQAVFDDFHRTITSSMSLIDIIKSLYEVCKLSSIRIRMRNYLDV